MTYGQFLNQIEGAERALTSLMRTIGREALPLLASRSFTEEQVAVLAKALDTLKQIERSSKCL